MKKTFCLTLDLEADHGWKEQKEYYSLKLLDRLITLLKQYQVPLTVFVTGRIIDEYSSCLGDFSGLDHEFQLHTYSHQRAVDKMLEIEKAVGAYRRFFDRNPDVYRPAYGIISKKEQDCLMAMGIRVISTLPPWSSLGAVSGGMMDIPVSNINFCQLPLGLSWMNFLGAERFLNILKIFGVRDTIVFYFHLHDLWKSARVRELPWYWRLFYRRSKEELYFNNLEMVLTYFKDRGYDFSLMRDLVRKTAIHG